MTLDRLTRRIAFRHLTAMAQMEEIARLQMLEGASDMKPGAFIRNPRGAWAEIQSDPRFAKLDSSWFKATPKIISAIENVAENMAGRQDGQEIVQDFMLGQTKKGEQGSKSYYGVGKYLSKGILGGRETPFKANKMALRGVKNLALNTIRGQKDTVRDEPGEEGKEHSVENALNDVMQGLAENGIPAGHPAGKKLLKIIDGIIQKKMKGKQKQMAESWLDLLRKGTFPNPSEVIEHAGLDPQDRSNFNALNIALRGTKPGDNKIFEMLRKMLESPSGNKLLWELSSARGMSASKKALRGQVIRLAHENPDMRPALLEILSKKY